MLPEAPLKRRKRRLDRPAAAEIETCQKIIKTKLERLKEKASKLPARERERLMSVETPGELVQWWLELRAGVDSFLRLNSAQLSAAKEFSGGGGQIVHPPQADPEEEREQDPAAAAAWDKLEDRLTAPGIRRVGVRLHAGDEDADGE